jgi:hypothetical protein
LKVFFWAALAILATWSFFENPLVWSASSNMMANRLLFVSGLILAVCEGVVRQKRPAAPLTPVWLRIALVILILIASSIVVHFLGNNSFFFGFCQGAVVGSGAWYAITAYRSNWATYSG